MESGPDFLELAWLRRLKQDDVQAFDALFRQYSARVYRFAYGYLKSRVAAEEIVQDCFLKIWERRHELRDDVPLKGYLFTTAHHAILNELRHQQRSGVCQAVLQKLPTVESTPASEAVEYSEMEQLYLAALAKLPPKRRHIFTMSRQQGKTYPEIAQELNLSIKTVETQITQALKSLRAYFRLHGDILILLPLLLAI